MKSLIKSTVREIKSSLGRYLAILAIVALGVGFFGGLKVTKPAMIKTLDSFLNEKNFYDFRLLSTIGFEDKDLDELAKISGLTEIEKSWNVDALCYSANSSELAYKIHSITDSVNKLLVIEGRFPENSHECLVDNYMANLKIGDNIVISDANTEDTLDMLVNHELTIVGTVRSPYYINFERGNTSIGNGKLNGFIYVPKDEFDCDYIGEVFITLDNGIRYGAYTDEYDEYIDEVTPIVESKVEQVVNERFSRILDEANEKIADGQKELDDNKKEAEDELAKASKEIEDGGKEIKENEKLLEDGQKELDKARKEILSKEKVLNDSEKELVDKKKQLILAKAMLPEFEYEFSLAKIETGLNEIASRKEEIAKAQKTINAKQKEIDEGLTEIEDARNELAEGKAKYDDAAREFDEKIEEAQKKIDDAKKELEDIEEPDYYVLDRNTNIGYACYESDSNIVASVANVFPVFFLLVAVLICMTTMNRMVEEQRTQIGVLKALGYSSVSILMKFITYAGSAALIGAILGYVLGTVFLPQAIWQGYNIMYNMGPAIEYKSVTWVAVLSNASALICSVGAAYFSVIYELKDVPANLIRPKAPKNGKRIFLEYITPLWKRMKFLHKVSARNIIRYKKRFFMMVLGIGGCTALVLTGYGIGDSVKGIADLQYENIQVYDLAVTFQDGLTKDELLEASSDSEIALFQENSMDVTSDDKIKTAFVVVPENSDEITKFLNLYDVDTGAKIDYPKMGEAILTSSLADKLEVKKGDIVRITDSDMNVIDVKVSNLCENYVYSYVYISKETYMKAVGEPDYNTAWANVSDDIDVHEAAKDYMSIHNVMNVSVISDLQERISVMMGGMDFIVLVVIMCAGALAFIVLYNLTNINITERIREIATIKVLGFYSGEAAQYVFRENLVLTAIGAIIGLPFGKALHAFIMYNIRIDMVSFKTYIAPSSYLMAILLTFGFALVVNGLMYFKLQKINMAESLKSIE